MVDVSPFVKASDVQSEYLRRNVGNISILPTNTQIKEKIKRNLREAKPSSDLNLLRYACTHKNEEFCHTVTFEGKYTIAIFALPHLSSFIRKSTFTQMFVDGTFKVPNLFDQMITICVFSVEMSICIPLVHIFLNTKEERYYEKAFNIWLEVVENKMGIRFNEEGSIRTCTCDYERGLINAVEKVFKLPITGCFFHYCQALWREAGTIGLKQKSSIKEAQKLLLFLMLLCYSPLERVEETFLKIREMHNGKDNNLTSFLDYFQTTWITNYGPKLWNYSSARCNELQMSSLKRTNNFLEGFHSSLSLKMGRVTIYLFFSYNMSISDRLADRLCMR
jgi:hypothetical protein